MGSLILRRANGRRVGQAGGSADARFGQLLDRWRRRKRWRFLLASLIASAPGVLLALMTSGWWELSGVFYTGAIVGMSMWVWDAPPEHIERWRRGAEGERLTARALRPLNHSGWTVVHDVARGRFNWDHVVVGEAGIFLLDSKNLLGEPVVEEGRLVVRRHEAPEDSYAFDRLGWFMRKSAIELKNELAKRTGKSVFVTAVVVVWPALGGSPHQEIDHVVYLSGPHLREWLASRPSRLTGQTLSQVLDAAIALDSGVLPWPDSR